MHILLTGGTGLIGSALCARLRGAGHRLAVLSRHPERVARRCGDDVEAITELAALPADRAFDAVINLAGEPIVDRRWSDTRKQQLRASRIDLTRTLVDWMQSRERPPSVLVSASAVGYYGDQGDHPLDEEADAVNDFAHRLCRDWEREAQRAQSSATRVCVLRIGVVLAAEGGMLGRMAPVFRLGLGGPLGSGEQWISWIALTDLLAAIDFLLTKDVLRGVFNATAPHPVTNAQFSRALAGQFGRRAVVRVPAFVIRALMGEMAVLLLGGQRVLPKQLELAGFNFRYPHIDAALQNIYRD